MLPLAYISHRTGGRLRIKIPSKKGDRGYFTRLRERFSDSEGINAVEVNSLTGSLLIIHDSNWERIAEFALSNNLFSLTGLNSYPARLQQRVSETFKGMNTQMAAFTGGEIDIEGLAFLLLLGAGIYQISVGNLTALPWYAAFWYAFNIFLKSGQGAGAEA
ncbi:MAG: HMA2 domain-containing protein [Planctomycetota bacterium]